MNLNVRESQFKEQGITSLFDRLGCQFYGVPKHLKKVRLKMSSLEINLQDHFFNEFSNKNSPGYGRFQIWKLSEEMECSEKSIARTLKKFEDSNLFILVDLKRDGKLVMLNNEINQRVFQKITDGVITISVGDYVSFKENVVVNITKNQDKNVLDGGHLKTDIGHPCPEVGQECPVSGREMSDIKPMQSHVITSFPKSPIESINRKNKIESLKEDPYNFLDEYANLETGFTFNFLDNCKHAHTPEKLKNLLDVFPKFIKMNMERDDKPTLEQSFNYVKKVLKGDWTYPKWFTDINNKEVKQKPAEDFTKVWQPVFNAFSIPITNDLKHSRANLVTNIWLQCELSAMNKFKTILPKAFQVISKDQLITEIKTVLTDVEFKIEQNTNPDIKDMLKRGVEYVINTISNQINISVGK